MIDLNQEDDNLLALLAELQIIGHQQSKKNRKMYLKAKRLYLSNKTIRDSIDKGLSKSDILVSFGDDDTNDSWVWDVSE